MTQTKASYDKLIKPNGQPQFGRFTRPFGQINHQDFDYCTQMDKPANRLQKHFHFNQFHFIGLHSPEFTLACALANVRYVANAFVYLFDHQQGTLEHFSFLQPLGMSCHQSNRPFQGQSRFRKGRASLQILGQSNPDRLDLSLRMGDRVSAEAAITVPPAYEPTVLCTRAGYSGWAYTQKHTALPVSGHIQWHNRRLALEPGHCLASSDWSCGYMRRETAWNWASISAQLDATTTLGLNLASGVNETGFTENTLWINGKNHPLSGANFEFNRHNRMEPWQITTHDGRVALTFVPEARHQEHINALVLASNFSQLPGKYYGTVEDSRGHKYRLDGIYGLAEDHYAKW